MSEYDGPHRTETQILGDDLTSALRNMRRDWGHMLPRGGNQQAPGWELAAGVHLEDHDHREMDMRRIDRIVSLRRYAQDVLNGWCRVVIEDRSVENHIPSGVDVPGMTTFLERHAEWMSGHEAAQDCRDEVVELAHRCHLIAFPSRRESMSIGRCPLKHPETGDTCDGDVRVRLTGEDRDGEAYAACNRCGEVAVASWWESHMFDDPETRSKLTDADVVTLMHRLYGEVIAQATVRQWVKRRVLQPSGETDSDGRRLFDRAAVVYAIDLHKRRERVRG